MQIPPTFSTPNIQSCIYFDYPSTHHNDRLYWTLFNAGTAVTTFFRINIGFHTFLRSSKQAQNHFTFCPRFFSYLQDFLLSVQGDSYNNLFQCNDKFSFGVSCTVKHFSTISLNVFTNSSFCYTRKQRLILLVEKLLNIEIRRLTVTVSRLNCQSKITICTKCNRMHILYLKSNPVRYSNCITFSFLEVKTRLRTIQL